MEILQTVKYLYPNLIDLIDYRVEDNANGPELIWINTEITAPTQAELDSAWTIYNNQVNKNNDILDFVSKYRIVETINAQIACCTGNKAKAGCTQENKDLIDLMEADFNTKLAPATTARDDKLAYLKATYTNEEVDIISEVNDYLINN